MVAESQKQILFQKILRPHQAWQKISFTIIGKKRLKFGKMLHPSLKKKAPVKFMTLTGEFKEVVLKMMLKI